MSSHFLEGGDNEESSFYSSHGDHKVQFEQS